MSGAAAGPEVTFRDSARGQVADTFVAIAAGTQQRFTAASFSLSSFDGTVVVTSSTPLSVSTTLAAAGGFESVAPAASSSDLIVPFSQGTTGNTRLTIFNPDNRQTAAVVVPVEPNGSVLGSAELTIGPLAAVTADITSLFPQSSAFQNISHLLIHVPTTILGPQHRVFAQAETSNFSDPAEGIVLPHADVSEVTAVPVSAAGLSGTFPFFVQGGDYVTELQFINASSNAATVTLTASGLDGNVVPGTAATSIVVPATGAVRHSVQRIFNLGAGITVGSVVFQSTAPVVAAEAIASVSQSGFVVLPVGPQPNTNFVFSVRDSNPQSFLGLALLNPTASPANLTLQYISDAGAAVTSTTLTINPSSEVARTLADLLPNALNPGFVYITSDVPITATALEGAIDNSILGALPATHAQPDYPGPTSAASATSPPPPASGFGSAAPVLTGLGPLPVPLIAGNPGFTTTITGTGFLSGVSGLVNGLPVPTTLLSPTVIQLTIPPEDLAVGTILKVSAINPAPTIASSNSLDLPVSNPVPVVLTLSPNSAEVRLEPNAPSLSVAVTGFGFKQGAVITVNGVAIPTTVQSATSLTGSIPQTLLLVGGTYPVSVANPIPSIGPAASVPLFLVNLLPILTTVDAGQLSFDPNRPLEQYPAPIILRGSNFSTASIFQLANLCTVAGLAVSPTSALVLTGTTQQFTAYLNGKATSAVNWSVNNIPGGDLTNGIISATGLYTAPATPPSGGVVTVTATSTTSVTFATATVNITATAPTTGGVTGVGAVGANVVTSHEAVLTVTVLCAGQYSVRVENPQPGGGFSQTLAFNVLSFTPVSTPSVTSLSPNSVAAGSPSFTLTITGSNFHGGAIVSFGSAVLFPTAVTATSITVSVPSYLIAQSDIIPVVVTNPDATGSSNRVLFTLN